MDAEDADLAPERVVDDLEDVGDGVLVPGPASTVTGFMWRLRPS
jgi:hypothetical protein